MPMLSVTPTPIGVLFFIRRKAIPDGAGSFVSISTSLKYLIVKVPVGITNVRPPGLVTTCAFKLWKRQEKTISIKSFVFILKKLLRLLMKATSDVQVDYRVGIIRSYIYYVPEFACSLWSDLYFQVF